MATGISANRLELLQIADAVAREKSIDKSVVIHAMEEAMQRAAKSRYGSENEIKVEIDAKTGEFLWATPTVLQTVISSIDGATGKVQVNPEMLFTKRGDTKFVCPNANGGKNYQAGAYSPQTNTM